MEVDVAPKGDRSVDLFGQEAVGGIVQLVENQLDARHHGLNEGVPFGLDVDVGLRDQFGQLGLHLGAEGTILILIFGGTEGNVVVKDLDDGWNLARSEGVPQPVALIILVGDGTRAEDGGAVFGAVGLVELIVDIGADIGLGLLVELPQQLDVLHGVAR